jgi:hypothetical protein
MAINENNKSGMLPAYAGTSAYNSSEAQINKHIQDINTAFVGKVTNCTSNGVNGSKTVTAINLIQQIDAEGNALKNIEVSDLPHYRLQAGIGAVILDPVPNDIGVFSCSKRDISHINKDTSTPGVPASFRQFSGSDAVMTGTIHTNTPEVYIHIQQDKTITVIAPNGYNCETNQAHSVKANSSTIDAQSVTITAQSVTINAPNITLNGNVTINGSLTTSGVIGSATDVVSKGKSFNSHTHSGVQGGNSNTGVPN